MSGNQKFVYQKWPDKTFPMANFVFSHDGHFGLEGGGGSRGVLVRYLSGLEMGFLCPQPCCSAQSSDGPPAGAQSRWFS